MTSSFWNNNGAEFYPCKGSWIWILSCIRWEVAQLSSCLNCPASFARRQSFVTLKKTDTWHLRPCTVLLLHSHIQPSPAGDLIRPMPSTTVNTYVLG